MKRILIILGLVLVIGLVGIVLAISEIQKIETNTLTSKNGVCEYYQKEFSVGETDSIIVNGEALHIEYLGNKNWKVSEYEGELGGHNYFVYHEKSSLKGVRFDFSYMNENMPEGNFGLREQDYYPWDCQGYSSSTGLVFGLEIKEGWNLVPWGTHLKDCYYALEDELCKDDVLVMYYYIPTMKDYMTEKDFEGLDEDNLPEELGEYWSEENENMLMLSSKWMYVKSGYGNKKVIMDGLGGHIPYRNTRFDYEGFKLFEGWNFLTVQDFMVYDDNWNAIPLTLNDIKGTCDMKKTYIWEREDAEWDEIPLEGFQFTERFLGLGFIVKVNGDCSLGYISGDGTSPPGLPDGDSEINDYLILEDVGNQDYRQYQESDRTILGIDLKEYDVSYYLDGGTYYSDVNIRIFNSEEDQEIFWNRTLEDIEGFNMTVRTVDGIEVYESDDGVTEWAKLSVWKNKRYIVSISEPKSEGGVLFEAYFNKLK